jgi:hypothetical protein
MVTSVPYQLQSSEVAKNRARKRQDWSAPGSVRRGPATEDRVKEPSGSGASGASGSEGQRPSGSPGSPGSSGS